MKFPFPVLLFFTPREVKFHILGTSKHGEEKSYQMFFCFFAILAILGDFTDKIKKPVIYALKTPTQTSYSQDIHIMIC